MPPRSKVAALPAEVKAWLDQALVENNFAGYEALAEELTTRGYSIGKSALLALDLMATRPEAESLVTAFLKQPGVDPGMRLAYVRALTNLQRYPDAVLQLEKGLLSKSGGVYEVPAAHH